MPSSDRNSPLNGSWQTKYLRTTKEYYMGPVMVSAWKHFQRGFRGFLVLAVAILFSTAAWAGGLDWLLPPLRNPCGNQAGTVAPVVSSQTTYTPRFGGGLLGAVSETPVPGTLPPSYGTAPVVVVPMGGILRNPSPLGGTAYLCVPYVPQMVSPSYVVPSSMAGGGGGTVPGLGNSPGCFEGPSASWGPGSPAATLLSEGATSSERATSVYRFGPSEASPALYATPAQPAQSPPRGPAGHSFSEKVGIPAVGGTPVGPDSNSGQPPANVAPPSPLAPLSPIPEESPATKENSPTLNAPTGSGTGLPLEPSMTPLPESGSPWYRPVGPGTGKPNPRDRAT